MQFVKIHLMYAIKQISDSFRLMFDDFLDIKNNNVTHKSISSRLALKIKN